MRTKLLSLAAILMAATLISSTAYAQFGGLAGKVPKASVAKKYLEHIAAHCNKVRDGVGVCATQAQADKANSLRGKAAENCDFGYPSELDSSANSMCKGVINRTPPRFIADSDPPPPPPPKCDGVKCPQGQKCDPKTGECKPGTPPPPPPKCQGVKCPPGSKCDPKDGVCKGGDKPDPCKDATCPPGQKCKGGKCVKIDLCKDKKCPKGQKCDPTDGQCKPDKPPVKPGNPCDPNPCGEGNICRVEKDEDGNKVAKCYCDGEVKKFGEKCNEVCPDCPPTTTCDEGTCRKKFPCPEAVYDEATCRQKFPCKECPTFVTMVRCWLWLFLLIIAIIGGLVLLWLSYRAKWKERAEFAKTLQQRLKSGGGPIEEKPTPPTFGALLKKWWWTLLISFVVGNLFILFLIFLLAPAPK